MNVTKREPVEPIGTSLFNASLLLSLDPRLAVARAAELLVLHPSQIDALLLSARAYRACGDLANAERIAGDLVNSEASHDLGLRELALLRLKRGELAEAHKLLERGAAQQMGDAGAWSLLADLRTRSGDDAGARIAIDNAFAAAATDPESLAAALALREERLADAEHLLRLRLRDFSTDVTAIRMMAELATRLNRLDDAEKLLRRALQIAPGFDSARELLARNLQRSHRPGEALAEVETLLSTNQHDPSLMMLKASLLVKTGDQEAARIVYERVLAAHPHQPLGWMSFGHVLKTLGSKVEGIAAYRRAIDQLPTLGEAWWSLANLKTVEFTAADITAMEKALDENPREEDQYHLHFALGKAKEDVGDYRTAFEHWTTANALRRMELEYDPEDTHQDCVRGRAFFSTSVLAQRIGNTANDPIFIVGMPRSGSTLVEQILASHSQIEGTMELPDMMEIAARLKRKAQHEKQSYPDVLAGLKEAERVALGQEYLDRTRIHRKTGRPLFIDKMPNNWANVGLIRAILPNARIIDTRRHPAGNCLSMWKQHFSRGQGFTYDLHDMTRYYCDYIAYMEHFDQVNPGSVYRVVYERLVADTEAEVTRLLEYLDLQFEESCMTFWQNDRAVRTPSSEQVRQPIFGEAVDHWQRFEPWLGPLLAKLEPAIHAHSRLVDAPD